MTQAAEFWNSVYDNDTAPWLIGEPQPAILALTVGGRILDPGCGAGEHTIAFTERGYDVLGVDFSPSAVEYARRNAAAHEVAATFEVADMLDPALDLGAFDTIVDSALFHVFGADADNRAAYVRNLTRLCTPGGVLHLLALSTAEPGIGPRIGAEVIRESFGDGWELEDLQPSRYRGRVTGLVADEVARQQLDVGPDGIVDTAAWLARFRRVQTA